MIKQYFKLVWPTVTTIILWTAVCPYLISQKDDLMVVIGIAVLLLIAIPMLLWTGSLYFKAWVATSNGEVKND